MLQAVIKPEFPASELLLTYAVYSDATGIGHELDLTVDWDTEYNMNDIGTDFYNRNTWRRKLCCVLLAISHEINCRSLFLVRAWGGVVVKALR